MGLLARPHKSARKEQRSRSCAVPIRNQPFSPRRRGSSLTETAPGPVELFRAVICGRRSLRPGSLRQSRPLGNLQTRRRRIRRRIRLRNRRPGNLRRRTRQRILRIRRGGRRLRDGRRRCRPPWGHGSPRRRSRRSFLRRGGDRIRQSLLRPSRPGRRALWVPREGEGEAAAADASAGGTSWNGGRARRRWAGRRRGD